MSVHGCWLVSDAYHRTQDQEQHVDKAQLSKIGAALARALDADTMMRMARTSGFCQRMRSVTPRELVVSVIAAMATQSTETIADVQRTFNALTGRKLAYKPFHKKLAKPGFAELMRMIVSHLLDELVTDALRPMHHSALSLFDDILLQDGSSFAIHAALAGVFPGRRTTISPAAVELHAMMSLWSDQPLVLFVAPDTAGERDYLPQPADLKGRLLIGDRGYQSVDYCRKVDAEGGYVLIRHQTRIDPLVTHCLLDRNPALAPVGSRLQEVMQRYRGKTIDVDVQWQGIGGDRRPDTRLRVVLIWNALRKDYMALVTNLDRDLFPPDDIYQIYRLRWQIELLFKEWKSYCNLHAFSTTKAPIAEGLMWAALAACIIKRFVAKAAQKVFDVGEISTRKTVMTVGHHLYALLYVVLSGRALRDALLSLLRHLSTQALRAHPKRDRRKGRLRLGIL
ncbi:MAG: IS4 family transposase, partial [Nitrospira sp.]